jgi:hypothetical protein
VPSLWVSHRTSNEAAALLPRVEALETILPKGAASSVSPRKREVELVQLDGREHFRGACVVAHNPKFLKNAKVPWLRDDGAMAPR